MKSKIDAGIIIPAYNAVTTIGCLRIETRVAIELIVVDDCIYR